MPLSLALLNVSNPDINVMDTLSRLSHDTDTEVAMSAVVALGFIGAGTNNARWAPHGCNTHSGCPVKFPPPHFRQEVDL